MFIRTLFYDLKNIELWFKPRAAADYSLWKCLLVKPGSFILRISR